MTELLALIGIFGIGVLYLGGKTMSRNILLAVQGEDEDMKIATDHYYSPRRQVEDVSELAAQEFLRQKQSGNIDRARELGKFFAELVIDINKGPLAGEMEGNPLLIQHHQYLLYTYVVNRVIAEHSPNSILAQTSLNVFYNQVENASPELYKHISDMAAFSLYILCERSSKRTDNEIGLIFADLCGSEGDPALVAYGNDLFRRLYVFCSEKMNGIPYSLVE